MSYVVAIDPPRGWALWSRDGLVAAGQSAAELAEAACYEVIDDVIGTCLTCGPPLAIAVERPHGRIWSTESMGQLPDLLANADSAGYIRASLALSLRVPPDRIWRPLPNVWRSRIGINVSDRKRAKKLAIKVAKAAAGSIRLVGPREGAMEHASEAVCLAMATWLHFRLVSPGGGDALERWMGGGNLNPGGNHDEAEAAEEARREPDRGHGGDGSQRRGAPST